jgi:hypothetical protein
MNAGSIDGAEMKGHAATFRYPPKNIGWAEDRRCPPGALATAPPRRPGDKAPSHSGQAEQQVATLLVADWPSSTKSHPSRSPPRFTHSVLGRCTCRRPGVATGCNRWSQWPIEQSRPPTATWPIHGTLVMRRRWCNDCPERGNATRSAVALSEVGTQGIVSGRTPGGFIRPASIAGALAVALAVILTLGFDLAVAGAARQRR